MTPDELTAFFMPIVHDAAIPDIVKLAISTAMTAYMGGGNLEAFALQGFHKLGHQVDQMGDLMIAEAKARLN